METQPTAPRWNLWVWDDARAQWRVLARYPTAMEAADAADNAGFHPTAYTVAEVGGLKDDHMQANRADRRAVQSYLRP